MIFAWRALCHRGGSGFISQGFGVTYVGVDVVPPVVAVGDVIWIPATVRTIVMPRRRR